MKWCRSIKDIPTEQHYAILSQKSTHIPGDEHSRTHPGHGYHARTEYSWDYIVFPDRESWESEIKKRKGSVFASDGNYVAISAIPATINTSIQVDIK
jgi:hypothetical protein